MGDQRPSVRTLDSGEKVTHYPGGRQVLVPTNRMAAALTEQQEDLQAQSEAKTEALVANATAKRESMAAGETVPAEKRVV